jgi:hypothetical protein
LFHKQKPDQQLDSRLDDDITSMPVLDQYTYVFAIGTFFALLDAYNNGASELRNVSLAKSPARSPFAST